MYALCSTRYDVHAFANAQTFDIAFAMLVTADAMRTRMAKHFA